MKKSIARTVLYFTAAVTITAAISVAVTVTVINESKGDRVVFTREEYAQIATFEPLREMSDLIRERHYGTAISDDALVEGALRGMLSTVEDPFARYYTNEEYVEYLKSLDGKYTGIGVSLSQPVDGAATILKLYEDSTAAQAGLLVGDQVTAIDGQPLDGLSMEAIDNLLEGEEGSEVTLTVVRDGVKQEYTLVRKDGMVSYVHHALYNQRTGFIRISKFSGNCVDDFQEAIRDLTDRGMKSLVIDLRNNPGGILQDAVEIADILLGEGVIVSVRSADGETETYRSNAKGVNVPLAVLINGNSASASEILAAAIQENEAGIIVGTDSYGKGTVQTTMRLASNEGWVKMTTAGYYTPDGNSIEGIGVKPDIDIDLADELKGLAIEDIDQEDDAQLWAALDEVRARAEELDAASAQ